MNPEKKKLYELLKEEYEDNHQLYTVLTGSHLGEQLLCKDGEVRWFSGDGFFWQQGESSDKLLFQASHSVEIKEMAGERIFCESFGGEEHLVICGAGHVSMPIIRISKMLGFYVTVIDDRQEFTENARLAGADETICKPFEEAITQIEDSSNTYYVVVSRGHAYDRICLKSIFQKKYVYVGMMGSRKRVGLVKEQLAEAGIAQEILDGVHTPIGLKIGAETPEEIAVSILAEIVQVRRQGGRSEGFSRAFLKELTDDSRRKVLATIISRKGSAPRKPGTKMIVYEDGSFLGTIGGGTLEYKIITYSQRMLTHTELVTVNLSNEQAGLEGMVCGGVVEVLLEKMG